MQIILLERIGRLGQMGDVVNVKDGYARNFLLPQKKALRATAENRARFEKDRAQLEARDLELKKEAEAVAAKLDGKTFLAIRQAGDTGQLYGSVTTARHRRAGDRGRLHRRPPPDHSRQADQDARAAPDPRRPAPGGDRAGHAQRRPLRGRGRAPGARRGRDGGEGGGARSSRPSTPTRCSRTEALARQREGEDAEARTEARKPDTLFRVATATAAAPALSAPTPLSVTCPSLGLA